MNENTLWYGFILSDRVCWCHDKRNRHRERKRDRVDDGGRKDCKRRLNGFIWENDNKCRKMSHFFYFTSSLPSYSRIWPPSLADSLMKNSAAKKKDKKASKKLLYGYQKATQNVMGAFSDFIEMLYIFHSASNLCLLLHIALQDMCRHLKRRFGIFCLLFLIFINNL